MTPQRKRKRMYHNIRRRLRQYGLGSADGTPPGSGLDPVAWVGERYHVTPAVAEKLIALALAAVAED